MTFELGMDRIQFPLLGNSLIVGLFSLLHIALAGLSVGFMVLAPIFEASGRSNPFHHDLARTMTRFTLVVFSVSSVLAVIMVELMIGLFPVTTMHIWTHFSGPIALAIAAFILQLALLYPYYHFWEALRRRSIRGHIALGAGAAVFMVVWVIVLDGMGSYMMSPVETGNSWGRLWNPTWLPLVLHRFGGDLLIAGYAACGYGAWRSRREADREHHDYYVHVFRIGWSIGLAGLLIQPLTGFLYAWSISGSAPQAYAQLIDGPYRLLLYLQFGLIALLFVGNHLLLRTGPAAPGWTWLDAAVPLAAVLMVLSIGEPALRRSFLYVLIVLLLWSLLVQRRRQAPAVAAASSRLLRPVGIGLGIVSLLIYLTMGTIRETTRRPDTVRGTISLADELHHPAADRQSHSIPE